LAAAQGCDSLQWIKLLEGLAMGVQCFAGEAPFLFMSGMFDYDFLKTSILFITCFAYVFIVTLFAILTKHCQC
jgi:hypothetical protein